MARVIGTAHNVPTPSGESILELSDVHVYYGMVHALKGIGIRVPEGRIVALLGANGAGKSTTLKAISGLLRPAAGQIRLMGRTINSWAAERIVRAGIVQCPEGRQVFPQLSVYENLSIGAFIRRDRKGIKRDLARLFELFPVLAERRRQVAGTLSGGEQQMLAIGRAMMGAPRVLLLDEPSLGLAPLVTREIFDVIRSVNKELGVTILLVEQNARQALSISDEAYILETGRVVMAGASAQLKQDEGVRRSYLGEKA